MTVINDEILEMLTVFNNVPTGLESELQNKILDGVIFQLIIKFKNLVSNHPDWNETSASHWCNSSHWGLKLFDNHWKNKERPALIELFCGGGAFWGGEELVYGIGFASFCSRYIGDLNERYQVSSGHIALGMMISCRISDLFDRPIIDNVIYRPL